MRTFLLTFAIVTIAGVGFAQEADDKELGPKCSGMSKGTPCWIELTNLPGCYIFNPNYNPPETVTWSGDCRDTDRVAVGSGTETWNQADGTDIGTGALVNGKPHGRWVEKTAEVGTFESHYLDGNLNGYSVEFVDGETSKGSYLDGKRNGRWVMHYDDGGSMDGSYWKDKKAGPRVIHGPNGGIVEGRYVADKKHGRWTYRKPGGTRFVFRGGGHPMRKRIMIPVPQYYGCYEDYTNGRKVNGDC